MVIIILTNVIELINIVCIIIILIIYLNFRLYLLLVIDRINTCYSAPMR